MKYRRFNIFCIRTVAVIICMTAVSAFAKKPDVSFELSDKRIFIGESTTISIKVNHYRNGLEPDLSKIKDCKTRLLGHHKSSFSFSFNINGRQQSSGFSGRIFTYSIKPNKTGLINLSPIIVDGTSFSGPDLRVQGIEKQNYVVLSVEPSATNVIVDEPFSVTLRMLVKTLPPPFSEAPPIIANNPPNIQIPYLNNDNFSGLSGPKIEKLLQPMVINNPRTPGFTINDFTINDFFYGNSLAKFRLQPTKTKHNRQDYLAYSLTLNYTPKTEGSYTFGPAKFKGDIYIDATPQGDGITKSIYTIAPAVTVNVIPPPSQECPPSYAGAVGRKLIAKTTIDAQTCNLGDPLTLTLAISGDISLENLSTPPIWQQENITQNFRIYKDSVRSKTKDNSRIYTYTIRPSAAGTIEIPPVEISFYNPETKSYQTVKTAPIPIRVNKAAEFQDSTVIDTAHHAVTIISNNQFQDGLIPAPVIASKPIFETTPIFSPTLHITILLIGPGILLIFLSVRAIRRHLPDLNNNQRRRNAAQIASKRIKNAPTDQTASEIAAAMRNYIAERFNINASSLTPNEAFTTLVNNKIPTDIARDFSNLLEHNFNAAFSANTTDAAASDSARKTARDIISKVEHQL